jgi:hypothetical protein
VQEKAKNARISTMDWYALTLAAIILLRIS